MSTTTPSKSRIVRAGEMLDLISRYERSSGTQRSFYERHNIRRSTFNYWLRKYRASEIVRNPIGFVAVQLREDPVQAPELPAKIELRYPDGTRLIFSTDIAPGYIRSLVPSFVQQ